MEANRKLKIAFLIEGSAIGGGLYVILEHASKLCNNESIMVYILSPTIIKPESVNWHPKINNIGNITWLTIENGKEIHFDIVIATWWHTCYLAKSINADSYIYFNQAVESMFYRPHQKLEKLLAESSYLLGFHVITEATWIQNYLNENYSIHAHLVKNGISKEFFSHTGPSIEPRENNKLRILVEGPLEVYHKNTEKAIELSLNSKADEVWLLTSSKCNKYRGVKKVFSKINFKDTSKIYRSCDVLIKISLAEGMFGPPLEMFQCGGTAVVYDVNGHEEYIENGKNGIVVKTGDEKGIINAINFLKENPEYLSNLKENALKTANNWRDWDIASSEFERALLEISKKPNYFNHNIINHFLKWQEGYKGITYRYKTLIYEIFIKLNKARNLLINKM